MDIIKANETPVFLMRKEVDRSFLYQGFTIPITKVDELFDALECCLKPGEFKNLSAIVNGVKYDDVQLINNNINLELFPNRVVIQIRYNRGSDFSKTLRKIFFATTVRVDKFLAIRDKSKTSLKLKDSEKEYVDIYVNNDTIIFDCHPLTSTSTEIDLASVSVEDLKEKAASLETKTLSKHEVKTGVYYRNPLISEYIKRLADGVCELCGCKAPFNDKHGRPYLESHHIIWISKGGEDSVNNTVALCPNCHRKMHIINDPKDVEILKEKAKKH